MGLVKDVNRADLDVMRKLDVSPFQDISMLEEVFIMQKDPEWVIQELLDE